MPDAWTLDTPAGPYTLNPTFSAPKYQPGSVSGPGVLRRDERVTYQRSGDGLPTPGPLTLIGRVWRDDQDQALMLQELEAIRAAVATCTTVTRSNNAGEYVYDSLVGGATPEITPDGLGGWVVKLDLWSGRAEPTFLPSTPGMPSFVTAATAWSDPLTTTKTGSIAVPAGVRQGDLLLLRIVARSTIGIPFATIGVSEPGWEVVEGSASLIGYADLLYAKTVTTETPGEPITWGLSNPADGMRWSATILAYRAGGPVTVAASARAFASNNGVAPSVDAPEPGVRLSIWVCQVTSEADTDGWTPPASTISRVRTVNPSTSPGGAYKFSTLVVEQEVPAGATGELTAQQEHGFTAGGSTLWMPRVTVVLTAPLA